MRYKYIKTGNVYRVQRVVARKVDGVWKRFVEYTRDEMYQRATRDELEKNPFGVTFEREKEDFLANFVEC